MTVPSKNNVPSPWRSNFVVHWVQPYSISSNSPEIKYQYIGRTHRHTDRQTGSKQYLATPSGGEVITSPGEINYKHHATCGLWPRGCGCPVRKSTEYQRGAKVRINKRPEISGILWFWSGRRRRRRRRTPMLVFHVNVTPMRVSYS